MQISVLCKVEIATFELHYCICAYNTMVLFVCSFRFVSVNSIRTRLANNDQKLKRQLTISSRNSAQVVSVEDGN